MLYGERVNTKTGAVYIYHKQPQSYSIDFKSITRNAQSYSENQMWADPTKIFVTDNVLINVQKIK